MTASSIVNERRLGLSWQLLIWAVNGVFLLITVVVAYWPDSRSAAREGTATPRAAGTERRDSAELRQSLLKPVSAPHCDCCVQRSWFGHFFCWI